jgi:hypothetical protein
MKKKYRVVHPSLYLSVGGKLQEMPVGSDVTMEEAHAKKHVDSGKLALATSVVAAEVGGEEKPADDKGKK